MVLTIVYNTQNYYSDGDRLCGLVVTDPDVRVRFPALPDISEK
jgi:hypothetical protein